MEDRTVGRDRAHPMAGMDSFSPPEIPRLVETRGVAKANAADVTTLALAVMAGAFIALGGVLSTIISTGSTLGFGPTRFLAGVGFSVGLILVVVGGAELFTGNNLVVMSWVSRRITLGRLLRNWAIVYVGYLVGALSVVAMVYLGRWWEQADHAVGATAVSNAATKAALPFWVVFVRAILANALVCLAVWLASGGRSVIDKIFAIIFPIAAFVASGFEHSVANMYFIPLGLLLSDGPEVLQAAALPAGQLARLDAGGATANIVAATLGNIVGGAVLVGLVYWFVYLAPGRGER
ncbi:MAG: formate/nitrite transporter family protein [Actinomycetota bacterium]